MNYNGKGVTLLTALNGNIESDPYLHRDNLKRPSPFNAYDPNLGDGYFAFGNGYTMQHDAQMTFNHGGGGVTRLEAIDIKLHDKLAYYAYQAANDSNGQFYLSAYDSILTRNIEYVNPTDTGSVFITTDKYKAITPLGGECGDYNVSSGGPGIHQGHIVLGYGSDCEVPDDADNRNDSIVFNFAGNPSTSGANVLVRAGYAGYQKNSITGRANTGLFSTSADRGKGYGGNITFDYMEVHMSQGNHTRGGYMEISTPNGNIWGKDSLLYRGNDGDLLVDAGLGSLEDTLRATRWDNTATTSVHGKGHEQTLNTQVPSTCGVPGEWRTGNIQMKGASVSFRDGSGNATFRTREGFIDTYDAFTVDSMRGHLLKYAGSENTSVSARNHYGDVSERDFMYTPVEHSGSVFFGADDNIMLNYGYSNNYQAAYQGRSSYDIGLAGLSAPANPYYSTSYMPDLAACRSVFDVNTQGYLWYRHHPWERPGQHLLYRGCDVNGKCSPYTGVCETSGNGARDLVLHFDYDGNLRPVQSGGFAAVAPNYIDVFTKFAYFGGSGSGLHAVPGLTTLRRENVQGYGLYMKSQDNGTAPEKRRATCEGCTEKSNYPIGKVAGSDGSLDTYEWPYIGFHDDARIHTNNQKSLIEAPVVEFFGHAELDSYTGKGGRTDLTVKADSLIFHDSAVFMGSNTNLLPYTTGVRRANDMRYGVVNDRGESTLYYRRYGPAIEMPDHHTPVIEFGYQRCTEPLKSGHSVPNLRSQSGLESTPVTGGDIIVSFKYGYSLPVVNTVVANHARISFISDSLDGVRGGEYVDACVRTELLRIRNQVEFYTDPSCPIDRRGTLKMTSREQMNSVIETGIYPFHLHLEPGSELSLPGEDSLSVISTTTVGGYGTLHENVFVKAKGILAPGRASLMEGDCQNSYKQGRMTVHNLTMEKDAVFRISISRSNCRLDAGNRLVDCTQTDTLVVQDSIFLFDKIPVVVLPETENLDEGCYLFLEYGDTLGLTPEYVKNLELVQKDYGDYYFGFDFSTRGKVYLCVMTFQTPDVQRYIDLPQVEGVTTYPPVGRHYVKGSKNFGFTATFTGAPLKVKAVGTYSFARRDLDNGAEMLGSNYYRYTIQNVVEPWTVHIGPEGSTVSNENLSARRVWSYKNTLYVRVDTGDVVSIYNLAGVLYRKVEVPAGLQAIPLERGVYVVRLKDGSAHKMIIN